MFFNIVQCASHMFPTYLLYILFSLWSALCWVIDSEAGVEKSKIQKLKNPSKKSKKYIFYSKSTIPDRSRWVPELKTSIFDQFWAFLMICNLVLGWKSDPKSLLGGVWVGSWEVFGKSLGLAWCLGGSGGVSGSIFGGSWMDLGCKMEWILK